MNNIKHIFFDLDRTLWDFEKNSHDTLIELFKKFKLITRGVDNLENFIAKYMTHNERLWHLYRENKVTKEELRTKRFLLVLEEYGISDSQLAKDFGIAYVEESPLKTRLFPFTIEALNYLEKTYKLHIITNGFQEVQHIKLKKSGLSKYFKTIITSEQVGVKKPDPLIFEYALNNSGAKVKESIMIGDDLEVDIIAAKLFGMNQVYFNPKKEKHREKLTFEINCLSQLMEIL